MARYVDADLMALNESEAYMSAQIQLERGGKGITAAINRCVHEKLQRLIADTPAECVREARPGKWLHNAEYDCFNCSRCGKLMIRNIYSYCPWCGACMNSVEVENE